MTEETEGRRSDGPLLAVPDASPGTAAGPAVHLSLGDVRHPAAVKAWFPGSALGHMWRRLDTVDFLDRGMLFAGVLLVCFVPFILILQALRGRSGAAELIRRFGLDAPAAAALRHSVTSPHTISSSVSGLSWVFFVLGGVAGATAIQELYERVFELPGRGRKDFPRRVIWLATLIAAGSLVNWTQPLLHRVGGIVLLGVVALAGATAFWWFSMWLLLGGRIRWRDLAPAAVGTGVAWFGMTIWFRLTMSSTITSNYDRYGSIGVVFAIMSLLIAMGVVIIVGAVFGVVWRERRDAAPPIEAGS